MDDTINDDMVEAILAAAVVSKIDDIGLLTTDLRESKFSPESLRTVAENRRGTVVRVTRLADAAARIKASKGVAIGDYLHGVFQ